MFAVHSPLRTTQPSSIWIAKAQRQCRILPHCSCVTHLAVQLVRCHTVPVGLFTMVSDNLTSVTAASEDALELLEGTFGGLEHVTELRLLGFGLLKNLSTSVLRPLSSIETLILDGFGSVNIPLPYLGNVIQKLSGTPIRRLVLNKIRDRELFKEVMKIENFKIVNASLKELIITEVPFNFEGSIRRTFPELVCFCGGGQLDEETAATLPALWDLLFMSDNLEKLILYIPKNLPELTPKTQSFMPIEKFRNNLVKTSLNLYPDLIYYFITRTASENCSLGIIFKIGNNLSKFVYNGGSFGTKTKQPICIQENNNLKHVDLAGTHFSETVTIPEFIGLKKWNILT